MPDQRDERSTVPSPLLAVVRDPEVGAQRLPYLLGMLDADDTERRLTAALAVCLVVERDPELVEYAVGRLVDRLDDGALEVGHALDYLAARHPRRFEEALLDLGDERAVDVRQRRSETGRGFLRNEYVARTVGDGRVGRARFPTGGSDDPRQVYTDDGRRAESEPISREESADFSADEATDDGTADGAGGADGDDGTDVDGVAGADTDDPSGAVAADDGRSITSGTLSLVSDRLSSVVAASRFDDLDVLTERRRERLGDVYRTVGTIDGEERAVALRVFRLPSERRRAFATAFRSAMERWSAVDDHESVLTVYDWDVGPRPWAALEYTDATLADRTAVPVDAAIRSAIELANGIAHAHRHGVVHGAVDPKNVLYPGTALTDAERQRPILANPGLGPAFAGHLDAADYLDPRYAAPEYYDDRYGSVDNATDVYGLGLVLYRLCTGEDPFDGPVDEVRERVIAGESPVPTAVDPDLPAALDQVVRKATATEKLKRYETVNHLRRELRGIDTDGA